MHQVKVPLFIDIPRKTKPPKRYYFNLNVYRNINYIVNNQLKHEFCSLMKEQLDGLKFDLPINIHYQLFYGDKRKKDKGNILSVIQKYFLDSLVNYGCLGDDNDDYIDTEIFAKPKYDFESDGYCLITITEIL